jgi:metallo-beta-lactamase class B
VDFSRFILVSTMFVGGAAWLAGASQRLKPEEFLPEMNQPVEPAHIIGNIYYVGTNAVSSFLIVTAAGHLLLDSGFNQSVPLIRDSITKLGFRFDDIRILLSTHAHFDHVAGHALIQQQTGAQIIASRRDAEIIARGGDELWEGWQASRVDRIVGDNAVVRLAGIELKAHLTPGHTEGCTTWTMDTTEGGHRYRVVFVGGYGINPGVGLVGNTAYPRIAEDYARTFRVLKSLKPDVFLAQHPDLFGFDEKVTRRRAGAKQNPFVDPEGYRKAVQEGEDAYLEQLRRERSK